MSRERGDFNQYLEEKRSEAIADIGKMEAMGFNCRALKDHVRQVDLSNSKGSHYFNSDVLLSNGDSMLGKSS